MSSLATWCPEIRGQQNWAPTFRTRCKPHFIAACISVRTLKEVINAHKRTKLTARTKTAGRRRKRATSEDGPEQGPGHGAPKEFKEVL